MSKHRPKILLAILAILGLALCYDQFVARPALSKGYETVMKLLDPAGGSFRVDQSVGPKQVQEALGQSPTNTRQQGLTTIETYEYRAGFPLRTYKLYVLYQGVKNPLLQKVLQNEEPASSDIMSVELVTPDKAEKMTNEPVAATMGAGGGGGGAGGGGRKKGPGVPPAGDPAAENNATPDASKPDAANPDAPKPDEPKPDEPKPDEPKPDEPKPDDPKLDAPKPDAPPQP
ncbi:MAG: hypothetical protein RIS70_603 [Planctomycetota bacterium]